ncbi:hypothetical protein GCM10028774_53760 [Spirosoma jeollabukense]
MRTLANLDSVAAAQYFDYIGDWVFTTYGGRLTAPNLGKAKGGCV